MDLEPLHTSECSEDSRPFVCLAFIPLCDPMHPKITTLPCRHLCLAVKSSCLKLFRAVNMAWPAMLNCSALPEPPELCFPGSLSCSAFTAVAIHHAVNVATPLFICSAEHCFIYWFTDGYSNLFCCNSNCRNCFSFRGPELPQPGQATVTGWRNHMVNTG